MFKEKDRIFYDFYDFYIIFYMICNGILTYLNWFLTHFKPILINF